MELYGFLGDLDGLHFGFYLFYMDVYGFYTGLHGFLMHLLHGTLVPGLTRLKSATFCNVSPLVQDPPPAPVAENLTRRQKCLRNTFKNKGFFNVFQNRSFRDMPFLKKS